MSVHDEKVDHAVSRLSNAGLSDNDSDSSSDGGSGNDTRRWAIIGGVVGGVVLLVILILAFVFWRRYRKRRAYNMVHRGADGPESSRGPGMSGGLMPLWMQRSGQNDNNPSIIATPPMAQTDDERLRRYSQSMLPPSNRNSFSQSRDVFNAEDRDNEPTENDSLTIGGNKLKEEEFASAYDGIDTGYGTGNGAMGGDRRSNM